MAFRQCIYFFLALGVSSLVACSEQQMNPQAYPEMLANAPVIGVLSSQPEPPVLSMLQAQLNLDNLRVQVFPHNGPYSTPHGREADMTRVEVVSSKNCRVTVNGKVQTTMGSRFQFNVRSMADRTLLECSGLTTVKRAPQLKSRTYFGNFLVKKAFDSAKQPFVKVINLVQFEDYLKGVVPAEVPASWPQETLRAQAIAARTYALYELISIKNLGNQGHQPEPAGSEEFNSDFYTYSADPDVDMDDTVLFQAYVGWQPGTGSTDAAVEDTRGLVMTYQNRIIKSFFHADSGGHTEDSESVWGVAFPYCRSQQEVYDLKLIDSAWDINYGESLVNQLLKLNVAGVKVADTTQSGRADVVQVITDKRTEMLSGTGFQYQLRLKSNWFTSLDWLSVKRGNALKISGRGFGHGVGMNQWGAKILADKMSWNHKQILKFYYSGIEIQSLADLP